MNGAFFPCRGVSLCVERGVGSSPDGGERAQETHSEALGRVQVKAAQKFGLALGALALVASSAWLVLADAAGSAEGTQGGISLLGDDDAESSVEQSGPSWRKNLRHAEHKDGDRAAASTGAEELRSEGTQFVGGADLSGGVRIANESGAEARPAGATSGTNAMPADAKNSAADEKVKAELKALLANIKATREALGAESDLGMLFAGAKSADKVEEDTATHLVSNNWTPARVARRFTNRGESPPVIIMTEVTGKIMDHSTRAGMPNASVVLHSFFPKSNVQGTIVTPVVTTLTTNDKGEFSGQVPLPEKLPVDYPGMSVSVMQSQTNITTAEIGEIHNVYFTPLVVGQAVTSLKPGVKTTLGIFWAPEHTTNVIADISGRSSQGAILYTLGQLDPTRWDERDRMQMITAFPSTFLNADDGVNLTVQTTVSPNSMKEHFALVLNGAFVVSRAAYRMKYEDAAKLPINVANLVKSRDNRQYILLADLNPGSGVMISGQVTDANGVGLDGAVVKAIGKRETRTQVCDTGGWFTMRDVPDELVSVQGWHEQWVASEISAANATKGDALTFKLTEMRPQWLLRVKDGSSFRALADVRLTYQTRELRNAGNGATRWVNQQLDLQHEQGEYLFTSEWPVRNLIVNAIGYIGGKVKTPPAEPIVEVALQPTLVLNISPNSYTSADTDKAKAHWYNPSGSDDMVTNWGNLPIEYQFDVSVTGLNSEEQPERPFELVLGVLNQGIVENAFEFRVKVELNGKTITTLRIPADSSNERTGSIMLGKLKGSGHKLKLTWQNDSWIPGQLDANIRLSSIRIFERP